MKYDKMVAENRKKSIEYEERAISEIDRMLSEDEQVVVSRLVKNTNLSRSFL